MTDTITLPSMPKKLSIPARCPDERCRREYPSNDPDIPSCPYCAEEQQLRNSIATALCEGKHYLTWQERCEVGRDEVNIYEQTIFQKEVERICKTRKQSPAGSQSPE